MKREYLAKIATAAAHGRDGLLVRQIRPESFSKQLQDILNEIALVADQLLVGKLTATVVPGAQEMVKNLLRHPALYHLGADHDIRVALEAVPAMLEEAKKMRQDTMPTVSFKMAGTGGPMPGMP